MENFKNAEAIAQNHGNITKEDNNMNSAQTETKKNTIHDLGSKAKMTFGKISTSEWFKTAKAAILSWIDNLPAAISRGCLRGLLIGIALNIIASFFWPELPETIPTIYGFFNGFVTLGEFLYKVALGGIAALFNGNFMEFGNAMMTEFSELFNAFWTWISAISF